jgi:hypothetical protein
MMGRGEGGPDLCLRNVVTVERRIFQNSQGSALPFIAI